jgi:predicted nucleotidyltransferase
LAEKYLGIAKEMAKELKTNKEVIGIAVIGSTARGDVHYLSYIDLLVLVTGTGIFRWERKIVKDIVVNVAIRSTDVLRRMAKENLVALLPLSSSVFRSVSEEPLPYP